MVAADFSVIWRDTGRRTQQHQLQQL